MKKILQNSENGEGDGEVLGDKSLELGLDREDNFSSLVVYSLKVPENVEGLLSWIIANGLTPGQYL